MNNKKERLIKPRKKKIIRTPNSKKPKCTNVDREWRVPGFMGGMTGAIST